MNPYLPLKRSTAWRSPLSCGLLGDWVPTCPVSPWGSDRRSSTWPWPTQMEKVHQQHTYMHAMHVSHFISTEERSLLNMSFLSSLFSQITFTLLNLNTLQTSIPKWAHENCSCVTTKASPYIFQWTQIFRTLMPMHRYIMCIKRNQIFI